MYSRLLFFCLLLFFSTRSYAQLIFDCAGKQYIVPAFVPAVTSPPESELEEYRVIKPIGRSKETLEFRFSFSNAPMYEAMMIIKGNSDSLWAECYFYTSWRDNTRKSKQYNSGDGKTIYVMSKRMLLSPEKSDSLLKLMILNQAFAIKDSPVILDSLHKANIKLKKTEAMHGPGNATFSIKIGDNYRHFNPDLNVCFDNPAIEPLVLHSRLYMLFTTLYFKSGLPNPTW